MTPEVGPPPFCSVCGRKMRTYRISTGFDVQTGEQQFLWAARCSINSIIATFDFRNHDSYAFVLRYDLDSMGERWVWR